jgi:hypothetical protein
MQWLSVNQKNIVIVTTVVHFVAGHLLNLQGGLCAQIMAFRLAGVRNRERAKFPKLPTLQLSPAAPLSNWAYLFLLHFATTAVAEYIKEILKNNGRHDVINRIAKH